MENQQSKSRSNRALKWAITNAVFAWLAWEAIIRESEGAGRVFVFAAWAFSIVTTLAFAAAAMSDKTKAEIERAGRPVPAFICRGFGMVIVGLAIWNGWWVTGIVLAWNDFLIGMLFSETKEKDAEPRFPGYNSP